MSFLDYKKFWTPLIERAYYENLSVVDKARFFNKFYHEILNQTLNYNLFSKICF